MKYSFTLFFLGTALAAPTKTFETPQLRSLGDSSGSIGLGALASLIPSLTSSKGSSSSLESEIPSLSSGTALGSSSGSSGFHLPSFSNIPGLSSLVGGSKTGSESESKPSGFIKKRRPELGSLIPSLTSGASASVSTSISTATETSSSSEIPSFGTGTSGSSTDSGYDLPSFSGIPSLSDLTGSSDSESSGVGSSTENGVTDKSACQSLTFIFARGSTETGNMGTVVGPPVATQLASLTDNKVVVQGVTYDASIQGNAELGANGGPVMAKLVKEALAQCPDTKVVLGGYSQGSMVVHNAANSLSSGEVAAAVLFGDPMKAESVGKLASAKVKEFCASGDPVCENGDDVLAHVSYGSDAKEAAQFLIEAAGLSTSS